MQGQTVTVTGSPFGCLAEQQFTGAVVTGCVSLVLDAARRGAAAWATAGAVAAAAAVVGHNHHQQQQEQPPLFIVDVQCMPGMEGGPVQCR